MGKLLLVLTHHVEPVAEVGETSAQMHFILKLLEDLRVVKVGVCEETV